MSLTFDLPSCSRCMATPKLCWLLMVLTVSAIWATPAISSFAGEESAIRFVGPADRVQPQSANEARTSDDSPPKLSVMLESIFRRATSSPLKVAGRQQIERPAGLTELPSPDVQDETVVTPNSGATNNGNQLRCHLGPALSTLSTNIALPAGTLPTDFAAKCAATQRPIVDRRIQGDWAMTNQHWSATCLRHRPLYFEEINAERYGYTASYCLQPLISAGRFFLTIPALPYKMAVDRPHSCSYTLGHYRPGSCAPRRWHRMPLKATGSIVEAGVVLGLILLIP
ncbi:MAG: hypothetical protein GXP26_08415 [Planctomycetes bacterium]|nr:hypothetical protein [Planctomycetota bacterium]